MPEQIHVATAANQGYFHPLLVSCASLAMSSREDLVVHVLDTGLAPESRDDLERYLSQTAPHAHLIFHLIDDSRFFGLVRDYGGGYSTYARLLIGSLIDADRVIYFDADFLFLRDVAPLYRRDMEGFIALAPRDYDTRGHPCNLSVDCPFEPPGVVSSFPYHTCCMLLVDLRAWREKGVEKSALEVVRGYEARLSAWDQTILNYVLRGRIGILDSDWAWPSSWAPWPADCNIHYISCKKPWKLYSMLPAFRLWRVFYETFLQRDFPIHFSISARISGVARDARDVLLAFLPFIRPAYFALMRWKGVPEKIVDDYDGVLDEMRSHLGGWIRPSSSSCCLGEIKRWRRCRTNMPNRPFLRNRHTLVK